MQTTKSGRMVKWGPIEVGQSINCYFTEKKGSKEQITLKSGSIANYYCFPIVLEGEDTVKMLPFNEQYDANLIQEIESSSINETTLCKLSKVPYTKKDGTQGGKLQFSVVKTTDNSTSDDLPPLEDYLNGTQGDQSANSVNPSAINANKTHGTVEDVVLGMCFKEACAFVRKSGEINRTTIKDITRGLVKSYYELKSELHV